MDNFSGTLVMNDNFQLFWSNSRWNSPYDGLKAQPKQWLCLSSSTWWGNKNQKELYLFIKNLVGEQNLPSRPRESVEFYENKTDSVLELGE